MKKQKYFYASLLTNTDYLQGIYALNASLKKHCTYPLLVFLTPNLPRQVEEELKTHSINTKRIPKIPAPNKNCQSKRFLHGWTKLHIWKEIDIEKIVYLDADTLVLKNIDCLFKTPLKGGIAMAPACLCNPEKLPNYPPNFHPDNCFFNSPRDCSLPFYGNSGVICLVPNEDLHKDMLLALNKENKNLAFPDQDFLNNYFMGRITPLDSSYNTLQTCLIHHSDLCELQNIKVLHYVLEKPWQHTKYTKYNPLYELWKDVYNEYFYK